MTLSVLLAVSSIGVAYARGGVFIIEPTQEVIEKVTLRVPEEVGGNVSVSNGLIDFFITNPSGIVLFCYNKTRVTAFSFVAEENGTYVLHLANTNQKENVNVTLNYHINFKIFLQLTLGFMASATATHVIVTTTTPFDWIGFVKDYIYPFIIALVSPLVKALRKFWKYRKWRKKYREPRTPVVIRPL